MSTCNVRCIEIKLDKKYVMSYNCTPKGPYPLGDLGKIGGIIGGTIGGIIGR